MTPAARLSAAIEALDRIASGIPAEQALTNWARQSRFAGSGDRAAVRDLVFSALRCRRSFAALGGGATGRGLMLGLLRAEGTDPATLFTGAGHAPAPLTAAELAHASAKVAMSEAETLDCPDWLAPRLKASLGDGFAPVMELLRHRAPVFLRVNTARAGVDEAIAALAGEGIVARPGPLAMTALEVTENARKIQSSAAYRDGLVELQDAASQAVVAALPLRDGLTVLDYCAGGGGKTLAMAAAARIEVFAHDADPRRMRDLPARAERAGVPLRTLDTAAARARRYDLVLLDVPCSGSGSWRRAPEGKWALTPQRLDQLCGIQAGILDETHTLVASGGTLAYVTCSLLAEENAAQIDAFLDRVPGWRLSLQRNLTPLDGGDGFHVSLLTRL